MNLKELRAAFAAKCTEIDALLGKSDALSGEEYQKLQSLNAEVEALGAKIEEADGQQKSLESLRQKHASRNASIAAPVLPNGFGHAPVMQKSGEVQITKNDHGAEVEFDQPGLSRKQLEAIGSDEYARCFRKYLQYGTIQALSGGEYKTLQEGSDTAGGFTVPEAILRRLLERKPAPTRLAGKVSRLTTSRDHLTIPRVNYTTDEIYTTGIRVTWTGEVPASSTLHRVTEPVWGQVRIPIYTAMLSAPITQDIIEDSMFGLTQYLGDKFHETRDLLMDNMILNGTSIGQPEGMLMNPIVGIGDTPKYVALGDPITADGIKSLAWDTPEQYEDDLEWVFNKTNVGKYIAQLKDGDGRYLWSRGVQDSGMDNARRGSLEGYPVTFSAFAPDRATGAYPMVLGDLKGYSLIERIGLSIQVLNEVYAEVNQKVVLGRLRLGGVTTEPWRIRVGKQA